MVTPLIRYPNPVAASEPHPPDLTNPGVLSSPGEDHIFGDVIGTIRGGLLLIFGGGACFEARMGAYSRQLESCWNNIKDLDLGHKTGAMAITVGRDNNQEERDQQSYRFGMYSERFKWRLCTCVLTGFADGKEVRHIEIPPPAPIKWCEQILADLNDLKNNLVDANALDYYLAHPLGSSRDVSKTAFAHLARSLDYVRERIPETDHRKDTRRANLLVAYNNWPVLLCHFSNLLMAIEAGSPSTYSTYDPTGGIWERESWV